MITGELKSQVDKIWNSFWTGGISNPLTVIEQFTFLLFLRRLDESQQLEEKKANAIGGQVANPLYKKEHNIFRWHQFRDKDPEVMYNLFTMPQADADNLTVFEHMKQLGETIGASDDENDGENQNAESATNKPTAGVFAQYMKGATFMIQTPKLLDSVVQMISDIKMDDRDTKGDLYEYLLSKIATAGTNGQFRTPRHIIKMMVEMMQPKKTDTICDPSCGTAGFLVAAGEYFHDHHPEYFNDKTFRDHYNGNTNINTNVNSGMFTGIEFDSTMLRIGAMNLQLHGIDNPQLIGKDALSESNKNIRDQFDLVLANPPFKGSLDYDGVESSLLKTVKTKKTELLFLSLILRMMKTGGRCAVIIPDGVLFGSSNAHKQLRQTIVEGHKLDAVISMPSGVFKPYAGVSTAILIFTKTNSGGTNAPNSKGVWFYDMQADGYSLDDKRSELAEKLVDGKNVNNDIPDIIARYTSLAEKDSTEQNRSRTDKSFLVPFDEIKTNDWDLSINRYKEVVYEEVEYDSPSKIIADIEQIDSERKYALGLLKELLK